MTRAATRPPSRNTWQRQAVLRTIEAAGCHLSAEEIHRRARRAGRPIALATVYRTLETFLRTGLVESAHIGDGLVRYGLASDHHDHLVCLGCGQWRPLEGCVVPRPRSALTRGFVVTGHRLELYGYCAQCRGPQGRGEARP
ncbi:MAG: transcriptional repressor [Armatimonadetes bacterium]|nr:transcriptional repressor [Armatimonadota bacterium]